MRQFSSALLLVVSFAMALPAQDSARTTGPFTVRGIVRDTLEIPIEGAVITVRGLGRTAKTNRDGEFIVKNLPEQTRAIEVVALGYQPRLIPVVIDEHTRVIAIYMSPVAVVLDSVRTTAATTKFKVEPTQRTRDWITTAELSARDLAGRTAMDAFELLRPQFFAGRPHSGGVSTTAQTRAQLFARDPTVKDKTGRSACVGVRACDIDSQLSVSINEGPLGSPDVLTTMSVASIREMRYMLPVDAAVRFGIVANGGPVLVVYTK